MIPKCYRIISEGRKINWYHISCWTIALVSPRGKEAKTKKIQCEH